MHYSRQHLTASVTLTTLTYSSTNDQCGTRPLLAHWPVRQKLNRVSSV